MVTSKFILEILSSPASIVQDFEGSFYLLTDLSLKLATEGDSIIDINPIPMIFTPTFFELTLKNDQKYQRCLRIKRNTLLEALKEISEGENNVIDVPWDHPSLEDFGDDFQKIQIEIKRDHLAKAVLMTTESSLWAPSTKERIQLLRNLLSSCPQHLFIYGFWDEKSGVLGATPEILFYRRNSQVFTMALAGTIPKQEKTHVKINSESLLCNPKELYEHQLVVDDIKEKLNSVGRELSNGPFEVMIEGPHVLELPHLLHLETKIFLKLMSQVENSSFDYELLKRLHPTSALGLRSGKYHWSWLEDLKGHKNLGHFGAPLGLQLPEGYLCLVSIRNLEWNELGSKIRAGCGIVSQSQLLREWEELSSKRNSVKKLLGIQIHE